MTTTTTPTIRKPAEAVPDRVRKPIKQMTLGQILFVVLLVMVAVGFPSVLLGAWMGHG